MCDITQQYLQSFRHKETAFFMFCTFPCPCKCLPPPPPHGRLHPDNRFLDPKGEERNRWGMKPRCLSVYSFMEGSVCVCVLIVMGALLCLCVCLCVRLLVLFVVFARISPTAVSVICHAAGFEHVCEQRP